MMDQGNAGARGDAARPIDAVTTGGKIDKKLNRKLNPSWLHRARPWLTRRALAKPPERRYRAKLRTQRLMMCQVLILPVQILLGQFLVIPMVLMGAFNGLRTSRDLKRNPHHFYEKDARTRELLARYDTHTAMGTWTIRPTVLTVLALPLAVAAMMSINTFTLGQGSLVMWVAVGLVVGSILSIVDVAWHLRARRRATGAAGAVPGAAASAGHSPATIPSVPVTAAPDPVPAPRTSLGSTPLAATVDETLAGKRFPFVRHSTSD